jgi:hypothetical protein
MRHDEFPGGVWSIDFEYPTDDRARPVPNGRPCPTLFAAYHLESGRQVILHGSDLTNCKQPPIDLSRCLTLAYNFQAESMCFETLGWVQPTYPIDPYAEYVCSTNGMIKQDPFEDQTDDRRLNYSLLDALRYHGVNVQRENDEHKKQMQQLAGAGGPYAPQQWADLRIYCLSDCMNLATLWRQMRDSVDICQALIRGKFMVSTGRQTWRGIPINTDLFNRYKASIPDLRLQAIEAVPAAGLIYPLGQFTSVAFADWLAENEIGWPYDGKRLDLENTTFREVARRDSRICPLAELRSLLSWLETIQVEVWPDGRCRPNLRPFRTATGRSHAKASEHLFLLPKFLRGFVEAPPGRCLTQFDYKNQEYSIGAAMAEDQQMLDDAAGGNDPYMLLAIALGLAPASATKKTHGEVRGWCKVALLAWMYGAGLPTLARQLHAHLGTAHACDRYLRQRYQRCTQWLGDVVASAYATRELVTPLGWRWHIGPQVRKTSLRNHVVQAVGGDVLRAACVLAEEEGIEVLATLHDSILIEADSDRIEQMARRMVAVMEEASRLVLGGHQISVEVEFTGTRYSLKDHDQLFFNRVVQQLEGQRKGERAGKGRAKLK